MAVENKYVNADVVAEKKAVAAFVHGENRITMVCDFETAAADDAGSVYRLFKNVPASLIPVSIRVSCDAIAGATDVDLGLYEPLEAGGAVVDKDCLADGLNISAGYTRILGLDGLKDVDYANSDKRLFELGGHTLATRKNGYDIALTMVSDVSAAGTILVIADFVQG
jgi:hypothetical protein